MNKIVGLEDYELEVTEVHLKRNEYEITVVQLVKALLAIDRELKQQDDPMSDQSTASRQKEAA